MTTYADEILYNGQIITMNEKKEICEAIAIKADKILCAGSISQVAQFQSEQTVMKDLRGKSVLPGMGDAHLHASSTCELLFSFDLYDIGLPYDMEPERAMSRYLEILSENRGKKQDVSVLRGTGWDPAYFMKDILTMPTAADIDRVCADLPVILRSYDHHYIWVNSKVLEDSGITKETPTPRNGVIWRDAEGNPTGLFQETTAIDLLLDRVPYGDYSVEEYEQGILHYQKAFGSVYGTTMIFDALATEHAITAYRNLAKNGRLAMRVDTAYATDPTKPISQMDEILENAGQDDVGDLFRRDVVKIFVDGTGLSIYMDQPYEGEYLKQVGMEADYRGYPQWTLEELQEIIIKANKAKMAVHVHCMGDGATRMTLDAFEYARAKGVPVETMRNTIAHFMAIREEDKCRMAKLGIIANVQPIWGCYYGMTETIITEMLGDRRARAQYPLESFKAAGTQMAAGTDFPVILPPSPFVGFKVGVTRTVPHSHPEYEQYKDTPMGPKENPMSEAVSLEDMIEMYTRGAAYQMFFDDVAGCLEAGKSADFVILNQTITETEAESLDSVQAESVYFKGRKII